MQGVLGLESRTVNSILRIISFSPFLCPVQLTLKKGVQNLASYALCRENPKIISHQAEGFMTPDERSDSTRLPHLRQQPLVCGSQGW